jgi:hypothetical protein
MKIPQYLAQNAPQTRPLPGPNGGTVDVSGLVGGLNSTLKDLEAVQRRESERLDREEATVWQANTLSELRMGAEDAFLKAQEAPEPGFAKKLVEDFRTQAEERLASAPPLARAAFQANIAQTAESIHHRAVAFEIGQRTAQNKQRFIAGNDTRAAEAYANPGAAVSLMMQSDEVSDAIGATPAERDLMRNQGRTSIAWAAATKDAETDPTGFIERAKDPSKDPVLSSLKPEHLAMLDQRARADLERAAAKAKTESDAALREAEKAVKELQKFRITGEQPSPEYATDVTRKTAGTVWAPVALQMLSDAQRGAGFGAKSIPAQQRELLALAGRPTDPETQQLVSYARTIHENQIAAYKENPWEAAARFNGMAPEPAAQIQAAEQLPQLIGQRVAKLSRVEAASGQPASVLQPSELQASIPLLQAMPLSQRAEVLGQMGMQLDGPHLVALADQLDKGDKPMALAMKLGADRTNAGRTVSELVLKGAEALADKTVKKDDAVLVGWRAEISALVRGALGGVKGDGLPKAEQDIIDAAFYVRAHSELASGVAPGFDKVSSNEHALSLVIGRPMERGGVKSFLPRGMKQDDFDEKLTSPATATQVPQTIYLRGQPVPREAFMSRLPTLGMRRDGASRYLPVSNNAMFTTDPEGLAPVRLVIQ